MRLLQEGDGRPLVFRDAWDSEWVLLAMFGPICAYGNGRGEFAFYDESAGGIPPGTDAMGRRKDLWGKPITEYKLHINDNQFHVVEMKDFKLNNMTVQVGFCEEKRIWIVNHIQ